ncbi:MAG: PEP/pyruvate-binding domain-containing protein [Polyangia bacterium]
MSEPPPLRITPLAEVVDAADGGKALGLGRLLRAGLRVPEGFVVRGLVPAPQPPPALLAAYQALGGAVAVRSSALGEDGAVASFAGQYESVLDVRGPEALWRAAQRCLAAASSPRLHAYRAGLGHASAADEPLALIVQRMVPSVVAGVLFTADPVARTSARLLLEAAPGPDGVVAGRAAVQRYVLSRDGQVLEQPAGDDTTARLDPAVLRALLERALHAESALGEPLDLEWALDGAGQLHFLQARPITTLRDPPSAGAPVSVDGLDGLDELDTRLRDPRPVVTRYNISEVVPGAVTPLTWDLTLGAVNGALQRTYREAGLPDEVTDGDRFILVRAGVAYLNVSAMSAAAAHMLGTSAQNLDLFIAGRPLPERPWPRVPLAQRLRHTARYFRLLFRGRALLEALRTRLRDEGVREAASAGAAAAELERLHALQDEAWYVHFVTSSLAGALYGSLIRVLSGGELAAARHHADCAVLLQQLTADGAEADESSLGLAEALEALARTLGTAPAARFTELPDDEALAWLRGAAPPSVRSGFLGVLARHGHRGLAEAELREPDWSEDPRPLLRSLRALVRAPQQRPSHGEPSAVLSRLSRGSRLAVAALLPRTRMSIVLRERSKSLAIQTTRFLRRAALQLAERLVALGRLPDADAVFFLSRDELLRLVRQPEPGAARRAVQRRRLFARQRALELPMVWTGWPVPLDAGAAEAGAPAAGEVLRGTPVSPGVVVGVARIARSAEEAEALQPGEVLIVPCIDIGWVPYFQRAAGLASEIGGMLSHGSVIAREVGLPTVINLAGALHRFRSGDRVRLDADVGELVRLP